MASEQRCGKPGCGALKIVGKPCTDADCPQQWVHHTATRPAPAATDTGLETVAKLGGIHGVSLMRHIEGMRPEYVEKNYKDELVRRSQAEELLAAKDAEIEFLKRVVADQETQIVKQSTLEADNAAKDAQLSRQKADADLTYRDLEAQLAEQAARVKEREQERDEYREKWQSIMEQEKSSRRTYLRHTEALEAKLAAAEKSGVRHD